jgi:hypothetical protein
MAIFEKEVKQNEYIALLDSNNDLVAFISPIKGLKPELLCEALAEKGLNVEVRQSKGDRLELVL